MNRHRTDVEIQDLGNGIHRINEYDFANCFLIEGENAACLIDTGDGIAELDAVVKSLTDKPLTVLITHAHADHVGGAVWFPEVRIHPADLRRGRAYAGAAWRLYFLYCHRYKRVSHGVRYSDALQKKYKPRLLTVEEGDTFDLGGRVIETYLTPGHSPGSLTFRDSLTGTVFTGDNVNLMVTLHYPGGTSVAAWIESAEKTLALAGDAPIRGGHGNDPIPREAVEQALSLARELTAAGNGRTGKTREKRGKFKYPRILYKENRVL